LLRTYLPLLRLALSDRFRVPAAVNCLLAFGASTTAVAYTFGPALLFPMRRGEGGLVIEVPRGPSPVLPQGKSSAFLKNTGEAGRRAEAAAHGADRARLWRILEGSDRRGQRLGCG